MHGRFPIMLSMAFLLAAPGRTASKERQEEQSWKILEGCRRVDNRGNDGDSFRVAHDGREYVFRLCFVDAAETSLAFKERVKKQADYWGVSLDQALALADEATAFTSAFLKDGFTVYTRFKDARGKDTRYFAMIEVDGRFLCEALVDAGLVRIYGYLPELPDGSSQWDFREKLRRAEATAKRKRVGGWNPFLKARQRDE